MPAACQPTSLSSDMRPLALGIAAEKLEQAAVLQLAIKEAGGGDVSCPDIDVGESRFSKPLQKLKFEITLICCHRQSGQWTYVIL